MHAAAQKSKQNTNTTRTYPHPVTVEGCLALAQLCSRCRRQSGERWCADKSNMPQGGDVGEGYHLSGMRSGGGAAPVLFPGLFYFWRTVGDGNIPPYLSRAKAAQASALPRSMYLSIYRGAVLCCVLCAVCCVCLGPSLPYASKRSVYKPWGIWVGLSPNFG